MTPKTLSRKSRTWMALLIVATLFSLGLPVFRPGSVGAQDRVAHEQMSLSEEFLMRYDGVRFDVIDRRLLPIEFRSLELTEGEFRFTLESWTGHVLFTGDFENPLERSADRLSFDGQLIGETVQLPEATFTLRVPYYEASARLRISSSDHQQTLVSLEPETVFSVSATGDSTSSPPQYTTKTVINNGPSANRIDIVFLGDGYSARDMETFDTDVRTFADYLLATPPFSEYKTYFNIHQVNVISNESGIDNPSKNIVKDTALDMTFDYFGVHEAVYTPLENEYKVYRAAALVPQADFIVALCNDREFGGSSGPFKTIPVVTTNPLSKDLLIHELGHSLAFLADESDGSGQPPYREPSKVNVTLQQNLDGLKKVGKWDHWVEAGQLLPTPPEFPGIGLFEGANGVSGGLYRPSQNCKMRTINKPFCKVCSEQIIRRIYYLTRPIDTASPQIGTAALQDDGSGVFTFSISPMKPTNHDLTIRWHVDGVAQEQQGTSLSLAVSSFTTGEHVITVEVKDNTPSVRRDPYNLLSKKQSWTVKI